MKKLKLEIETLDEKSKEQLPELTHAELAMVTGGECKTWGTEDPVDKVCCPDTVCN